MLPISILNTTLTVRCLFRGPNESDGGGSECDGLVFFAAVVDADIAVHLPAARGQEGVPEIQMYLKNLIVVIKEV